MILAFLFVEGEGEVILTSRVNAKMSAEILDTFLISTIENRFGDEVIFQDGQSSLQEREINSKDMASKQSRS